MIIKYKKLNNKAGFTLIEFIVYATIFGASMAIMGRLMVGLMQEQRTFMAERNIGQHGRFLLDRIGYSVRNANAVEVSAPAAVKLISDDYDSGGKLYSHFTIIDGQWQYAETAYPDPFATDWLPLSSPRVSVSGVTITQIKDSVNVSFTLNHNNEAVDFQSVYAARQPSN